MYRRRKYKKNDYAVSSPLETIIAFSVVILAIVIFLSGMNTFFVEYDTQNSDSYNKNIHVSSKLMGDSGQSNIGVNNWQKDSNSKLSVLGLMKSIDPPQENQQDGLETDLFEYIIPPIGPFTFPRGGGGGGNSCFLAGTKIALADNSYKNIEEIQVGDLVKAYDENKNIIEPGKVVNVFHHSKEEMTDYYVVINNYLKITPNHMVYVNKNWKFAGELVIGDILGLSEKEGNKIYSIEYVYEKHPTYDFEVEKNHNYMVKTSKKDILAHNAQVAKALIAGHWSYEDGNWVWHPNPDANTQYEIAYIDLEGEEHIENPLFVYGGNTFTHLADSLFQNDLLKMNKINLLKYGMIDFDKILALKNTIDYETAKESLGLDFMYEFHLTIKDMDTGEELLSYGKQIDQSSQVVSSFTRNVVIFRDQPDALGKLTLYIFK